MKLMMHIKVKNHWAGQWFHSDSVNKHTYGLPMGTYAIATVGIFACLRVII